MCFRIVNKKDYVGLGVYIGHPSVLGNPYRIGKDGSREEVIEKYRKWLWEEIQNKQVVFHELLKLLVLEGKYKDLVLICHCYPQKCHGDVIIQALEWLRKQGKFIQLS